MLVSALTLIVAQAAAVATAPAHTAEQARLAECLGQARTDPATAITTANLWLIESHGPGKALPQQCLGQAYVSVLRWDAAHDAFLAARDLTLSSDYAIRARLGAMAGNAALAGADLATARADLDKAVADAALAGDKPLAGSIATRCRGRVAVSLAQTIASAAGAQPNSASMVERTSLGALSWPARHRSRRVTPPFSGVAPWRKNSSSPGPHHRAPTPSRQSGDAQVSVLPPIST